MWDARLDQGKLFGPVDAEAREAYNLLHGIVEEGDQTDASGSDVGVHSAATGINALGSGSDYTVFLQRTGVGYFFLGHR